MLDDHSAVVVHLRDLVELLDYVQPDEEKDFDRLEDGNSSEHHVVHVIRRLRKVADAY